MTLSAVLLVVFLVSPGLAAAELQCTRGDYPYAHWEDIEHEEVPLVPLGWTFHTNKLNLRLDKSGYTFCSNGQGGKFHAITQPRQILTSTYVPGTGSNCSYRQFTRRRAQECLGGQWVHLDGDSISRDAFFDIAETLNFQSECSRAKAHTDMVVSGMVLNKHTVTTFGFNPAKNSPCETDPTWAHPVIQEYNQSATLKLKAHPDFWIWSSGLWFFKDGEPDTKAQYTQRLKCLGELSRQYPGLKPILRTVTSYQKHEPAKMAWSSWQNAEAIKILRDHYGWGLLDVWKMSVDKPELSVDGVHYSGKLSKTATNILLNMMCAADNAATIGEEEHSRATAHHKKQ